MFEIELSRKAEKFYRSIDDKAARILNRCFEILSKEPFYHANIKKLHGEFEGSYRYRSGSLRIIYSPFSRMNGEGGDIIRISGKWGSHIAGGGNKRGHCEFKGGNKRGHCEFRS